MVLQVYNVKYRGRRGISKLNTKLTPISILSISALIGLTAAIVFILITTQRPYLGLELALDDDSNIIVVSAGGPSAAIPLGTKLKSVESKNGSIKLLPIDLTIEPDGKLHTYEIYDKFLQRQGNISHIIDADIVVFINEVGASFTVSPDDKRPLTSLPTEYWVQLVVGLFAWLISSSVFAFRAKEISARYLLLSGFSTLIFAPFAAIYATREIAMPETIFMWLSDGNFLGGSIFTASFVALLLCYPKKIAPNWVGISVVALYIVWFIMQQNGVFQSMTFARRSLVMIGVFSTFIIAAIHWFKTKQDPVNRAALQWFLLSWMLGTCLFWFFILMPQMFGVDTSTIQGYAFSLFLLVYAGLAFGILRYKLFALGQWWGNIVLWALTVLMLVVFDLLFLLALQFSSGLSISLALLLSGILWLPLRSFVWNRFLNRHTFSREDQLKQIVDIALTPPGQDVKMRWRQLLENIFDPLHFHETDSDSECMIENDGQILLIPKIGPVPALNLEYAYHGRRLFTSSDIKLAKELAALLHHILDSRSAYEKGVSEERQRIAQDMHDNIGAQLLGALHNQNIDRKDTLIRETLSDLRDIINDTSRIAQSYEDMLAGLRAETTERLSGSGITLSWSVKADDVHSISPKTIHALKSIIREAVSNIIKHAAATFASINIQCLDDVIYISIEDNGNGLNKENVNFGNGLKNMKSRITGLNGILSLSKGKSGLHLNVTFPLSNTEVLL